MTHNEPCDFKLFSFFVLIKVHTVKGTGVLQQYVDRQQLTKEMDGDFEHSHNDWLTFRLVRIHSI